MDDFLSTKEMGWLLDRSAASVRRMIREGEIEGVRLPDGFRVPKAEALRVSRERIETEAGRKLSDRELEDLIDKVLTTNEEQPDLVTSATPRWDDPRDSSAWYRMIGTAHARPESSIVPRPSRRPFASLLFAVVLLAGIVTPALGWANGGNLGNAYGTHDWIVSQAVKVFGDSPPAWFDLNAALLATDDPDKVFWATNEHVFNEKGYGRGAVDRITEFYHQALVAHQAGDDLTASITFGWMAHYYGDILQPYHTNYAAVDLDASHRRYEHARRAADPEPRCVAGLEHRQPHAQGRRRRADDGDRSRGLFAQVLPGAVPPVQGRRDHARPRGSRRSPASVLKRASSDLADMLYSIDQGVGDAPPAASVKATVKYRYAAKNTTQTVYVTVKGAEGQPLEGVRVDIAFPKGTGGTTLLRRYTTKAGTVTAYGAIGASPFGVRRDVEVTVKTGDVVTTATTWFTTSRRLAAARPASSRGSTTRPSIPGRSSASDRSREIGSAGRCPTSRSPGPGRSPTARSSRRAGTRAPWARHTARCRSRTRRRGAWSRSWRASSRAASTAPRARASAASWSVPRLGGPGP